MTLNCFNTFLDFQMALFVQRNPESSKAEALNQAREFLDQGMPFNDNEDKFFLQAAGLFLMFKDDNELSMAGAEEMIELAAQLEELSFQAAMYNGLKTGLFIPTLDENNKLSFLAIPPEEFEETGVSSVIQEQYQKVKDKFLED